MQQQSTRRFLTLVTAIVIGGFLVVGFAWQSRQYHHPTLFDSWENAYAVFDCNTEEWMQAFESTGNADGIRTRDDGVIYIEPTSEAVTGDGARLDVFLDTVDVTLSDTQLVLPDGSVLDETGAACSGEEAVLQVHRWDPLPADEPAEIIVGDFDDIIFLEDGQSFVIALAPLGSKIPPPPAAAEVSERVQRVVDLAAEPLDT